MNQTGPEFETTSVPSGSGEDVSDAEAFGRQRARGDAPRERSCMVCGNKFESEGWHNRLCSSCRKRSVAAG